MTHDVLVIDDSATVRKLVEISLRGRPLRPHFASSGGDGIRCAATVAPSAILLDFVLPDMTAVEVCRALAADSRTQTIPILVVTAKHERTRSEFQTFPAVVDFIAKPFTSPDLLARIDRAIAGTTGRERDAQAGDARRDPIERAARLLFARLRDGLALVPAQLRALDPGPIAPQLARRLLTPQVVEGILSDLRPLVAELVAGDAAAPGPHDSYPGEPVALDTVVDRAPGFSARIQGTQLGSLDRRILALTDGRLSVAETASRIAGEPHAVARAVRGLLARGLLREVHAGARPRPVVICEPDVESFQQPLRALLAQRAQPRELIVVDRVDEVAGATHQHQPCLVIVNATSRIAEACAAAQALRSDAALSDLAMIAVLEPRASPAPDLVAAGFDTVLAKPVRIHELERFLTASDL